MQLPESMAAIAGAGLGVGLITACWGQIKMLLQRIVGLLVVTVTIEDSVLQSAISALITYQFKKQANSFPRYIEMRKWVRPLEKEQHVGFETLSEFPTVYWKGWRPMLAKLSNDQSNNGRGKATLTFIRWTFDPDQLIEQALREFNECQSSGAMSRYCIVRRYGAGRAKGDPHGKLGEAASPEGSSPNVQGRARDVHRPVGYRAEDLGIQCEGKKVLDCMALSGDALDAAQEARRWHASKNWYRDHRIPWRRGWLLHGKPGTGKTTFINGIAQDLGLPVYSFDIGSMSNRELSEYWQEALANSPALVLIEDIDAVFDGRVNVLGEMGGGLSFDALLNTIGGISNVNGILLAVTTNNIDKIDPALGIPQGGISSRPGRLDRVVEMAEPNTEGRTKIANRILADMPEARRLEVVNEGQTDTGAQFQERCSAIALRHYWTEREKAA